jgi:parallel beta-helix repeat protein
LWLTIDVLEDRQLPSCLTVTNTSDSGCGSLRQAIMDANTSPGSTIQFHIGSGAQVISPASALPAITGPVILDATTQPGPAGVPLIELNGTGAGAGATGLTITGGGSTVKGLFIDQFAGDGILVTSAGNTIGGTAAGAGNVISGNTGNGVYVRGSAASGNVFWGNLIGTTPSGLAALPNGRGVFLDRAPNNTIGGTTSAARNVISGTTGGVDVLIDNGGAAGNLVEGNYIGLAVDGTSAVPSTGGGIRIGNAANQNTIGGTGTGAGNVISGNPGDGVLVDDWDADAGVYTGVAGAGNAILGHLIGLNAAGSAALANARHGIEIINGAASNPVGPGNTISGNALSGIYVNGPATSNNVIQGNFIGTNPAGTAALANGSQGHPTLDDQGIKVENAANDTIAGNVISGNSGNGILLAAGTTGVIIQGNDIGTNANSAANLGNGADGIRVDSSSGNKIGGMTKGAGNVISGNGGNGITLLAHVGITPPFTPGSNDPGGLTLTSAGSADGFTLSTFIDHFTPNPSGQPSAPWAWSFRHPGVFSPANSWVPCTSSRRTRTISR